MSYKEFIDEQFATATALGNHLAAQGATKREVLRAALWVTRRYYSGWWKLTCEKFAELRSAS